MKRYFFVFILIFSTIACFSKDENIKIKSIEKNNVMNVGYTYWWGDSGPFTGLCGNPYSFVFLGTINKINNFDKSKHNLYISQEGIIEINKILFQKELPKKKYNNEKYFSSDCFYDLGLKEGDKVIVFLYEYENNFSISGDKSILKINDFNEKIVQSLEKYIKANQNPLVLEKEIEIYEKYGLKYSLEQIIECKKESLKDFQ